MAPNDNSSELLSKRGQYAFGYNDFLISFMNTAFKNLYDADSNPWGVINLGTSVNSLMHNEIEERLRRDDVFFFSTEKHQHYFQMSGTPTLRTAVANFFNRYFNVAESILPEELVIMSGSSGCLDALAHSLFDPDDIYLTPTPTYARIFTDFNDRAQVMPVELELPEEADEDGISFNLTSELLENKILTLAEEGKTVKGFVLISPQNPMGDVYSPILLSRLLEVCAKYKLHVIIDEVYILSMCGSISATSVMSLHNIPDPLRTHVVWSLSKDFCLAGFRLGVVWTKNSAVRQVLRNFTMYNSTPSITQDAASKLLNDYKWLDEVYFPRSRERLQENYNYSVEKLESIGAVVRPSQAGLFVWFHLKKYLYEQTLGGEMELFEECFDAGVYIVPGTKLYCKAPGWFRMVYAVSRTDISKAFEIMNKILRNRKRIIEDQDRIDITRL